VLPTIHWQSGATRANALGEKQRSYFSIYHNAYYANKALILKAFCSSILTTRA
jgi:hypothetical protein